MQKGSVYILRNPVLKNERNENLLKIGRTTKTPEQRAKELRTTGVPAPFDVVYKKKVPDCVLAEKLVHQELEIYRYKKDREFFELSEDKAITLVQKVIQENFYNLTDITKNTYLFNECLTLSHSFQCNGIILLIRYTNFFVEKPSLIDMWWCKPKDCILITNRIDDAPEKIAQTATNSNLSGSLSDIVNIHLGDRLAIIEPSSKKASINQSPSFDDDSSIRIVKFQDHARMIGFMENIKIHPGGFPIPFGMLPYQDVSQDDINEAFKKVTDMGMPRSLPDLDYESSLKSGFEYYT